MVFFVCMEHVENLGRTLGPPWLPDGYEGGHVSSRGARGRDAPREGCGCRLGGQTAGGGALDAEQILPPGRNMMRAGLVQQFLKSSHGEIREGAGLAYRVDGEEEVGKWLNGSLSTRP